MYGGPDLELRTDAGALQNLLFYPSARLHRAHNFLI